MNKPDIIRLFSQMLLDKADKLGTDIEITFGFAAGNIDIRTNGIDENGHQDTESWFFDEDKENNIKSLTKWILDE